MYTIFATLCQNEANFSSLKLSIFVVIDDRMTVSADSRKANIDDMKYEILFTTYSFKRNKYIGLPILWVLLYMYM